jgi:hypothetical protein
LLRLDRVRVGEEVPGPTGNELAQQAAEKRRLLVARAGDELLHAALGVPLPERPVQQPPRVGPVVEHLVGHLRLGDVADAPAVLGAQALAEFRLAALEVRVALAAADVGVEPAQLQEDLAAKGDVRAVRVAHLAGRVDAVAEPAVGGADEVVVLLGEKAGLPVDPHGDHLPAGGDGVVVLVGGDEALDPLGVGDGVVVEERDDIAGRDVRAVVAADEQAAVAVVAVGADVLAMPELRLEAFEHVGVAVADEDEFDVVVGLVEDALGGLDHVVVAVHRVLTEDHRHAHTPARPGDRICFPSRRPVVPGGVGGGFGRQRSVFGAGRETPLQASKPLRRGVYRGRAISGTSRDDKAYARVGTSHGQ